MVAVDEPRALYERPLSAFVAKFIGGHNLFSMSQLEGSIAPRLRELLLEKVAARMDIANSKLLFGGFARTISFWMRQTTQFQYKGELKMSSIGAKGRKLRYPTAGLAEFVCRTNPVDSSNSALRRGAEIKLHIDCANAVLVKDDLS